MEKYCKKCGRVFDNLKFKICPYCGSELSTRYGRQPIPRKLRHEVFKRDGYRCRECGASKDETSLEIDHILPVAKGGTNDIDNLQTLCRECNRMKHTDEWVGGESNIEIATNELNNLKKQLKDLESKLKKSSNNDEIIEYKFRIKKLTNEYIPNAQNKLDNLLKESEAEKNKLKAQKGRKKKKKDKLFKKLYVELDDNLLLKIINHFNLSGKSNEDNLRLIVNTYNEKEIYNTIDSIKNESSRKLLHNKLSKQLSNHDITLLSRQYSISNKKSVITYLTNRFTEEQIDNILISLHKQDKEKNFKKNMRKIKNQYNINDKKHDEILKQLKE